MPTAGASRRTTATRCRCSGAPRRRTMAIFSAPPPSGSRRPRCSPMCAAPRSAGSALPTPIPSCTAASPWCTTARCHISPSIQPRLLEAMTAEHRAAIQGGTDSEHLLHLILSIHAQLDGSLFASLEAALRRVLTLCREIGQEPHLGLNVLLTDGERMVGSRWRRTLHFLEQTGTAPLSGRAHRPRHEARLSRADHRLGAHQRRHVGRNPGTLDVRSHRGHAPAHRAAGRELSRALLERRARVIADPATGNLPRFASMRCPGGGPGCVTTSTGAR